VGRSTLQSFIAERMALLKMPYGEACLLKARVHEHVEAPSDQMQYFAEISEISSTVDFDSLQTSTAAFLISSRSSRRRVASVPLSQWKQCQGLDAWNSWRLLKYCERLENAVLVITRNQASMRSV
jgi:hypothetical protein